MPLHASCAAHQGDGVLILGPSGAGKSDLVLRLMGRGWDLVADDQVELAVEGSALMARTPPALAGMLEVRGLGLFRDLPHSLAAPVRLVVALLAAGERPHRLPDPARWAVLGLSLPRIALAGLEASAPDKLAMALEVVCGRRRLAAGAFADPAQAR
jgi:HPr kinase/phosphorylase